MTVVAYLGLGANLGDPIQQLIDARLALEALPSSIDLQCSSFYVSSPVGYDDQPDFINCVIELHTDAEPLDLLDATQNIENNLGRKRIVGNQNAPRLIDIDILLYGDRKIGDPRLIVPHPRMAERLFVLKPLLELIDSVEYQTQLQTRNFGDQQLTRLVVG